MFYLNIHNTENIINGDISLNVAATYIYQNEHPIFYIILQKFKSFNQRIQFTFSNKTYGRDHDTTERLGKILKIKIQCAIIRKNYL